MSVKKRSWSPLSEASPSFFWSVPKTGSATDEQPGPREKITLSTVARRFTTASPCSALQASSCAWSASFTRLPSTTSPPASLISSTARLARPYAALPKKAAGPLSGHMPPILTVPSLWNAPTHPGHSRHAASSVAAANTNGRLIAWSSRAPAASTGAFRLGRGPVTVTVSPRSSVEPAQQQDRLGLRRVPGLLEIFHADELAGTDDRQARSRAARSEERR